VSQTHHTVKHTHARTPQPTSAQSGIHVAIIMDGNGRWANARGRPRTAGHIAGARVVRKIVEAAPDCGIGMLTLYAFSADNWARPSREVALLMRLFRRYLVAETDRCVTNDVRMRITDGRRAVGRPARVGDSGDTVQWIGRKLAREIIELALGAAADELAILDGTNAGRVIAAIFEPLQAIEQPLRDVRFSDDPDNSTHVTRLLFESSARGSGGPNRLCPFAPFARRRGCRPRSPA